MSFLGCPLDLAGRADQLCRIQRAASLAGPRLRIEGLNVAKLVDARTDADLMSALREAEIVHVDGQGIAFGLAMLGIPAERCAGIDLMQEICRQASMHGHGIYLLGAREEVVAAAVERLSATLPALVIAGWRDGYFTEDDEPAMAEAIAASGAAILFIGISSPKKELFLRRNWERLGVPVAMGVGGAFEVVSGRLPRAPLLMQRIGLEWLFRLSLEPRHLARRYLRTNAVYTRLLAGAWIGHKIAAAKARTR